MLTAEGNRLGSADRKMRRRLKAHIKWLRKELLEIDDDMDSAIQESPLWRAKDDILKSVPGTGTVVSITLISELPELGLLNSKEIAALARGCTAQSRKRDTRRQEDRLGWSG